MTEPHQKFFRCKHVKCRKIYFNLKDKLGHEAHCSHRDDAPMRVVAVHFPQKIIDVLDFLTSKGIYPNRSEVIRQYVMMGLRADKNLNSWLIEGCKK